MVKAPSPARQEIGAGDEWDQPQVEKQPLPPPEPTVRVKCISDRLPWTHEKSLEMDEEADVPQSIADLMVKKKQVEILKGG